MVEFFCKLAKEIYGDIARECIIQEGHEPDDNCVNIEFNSENYHFIVTIERTEMMKNE